MKSKLFDLGDIVALKSHPYLEGLNNIIISGEHNLVPPLMVVVGILKINKEKSKASSSIEYFKYKCLWFSSKSVKFIDDWIHQEDLKLILKNFSKTEWPVLKKGDKVLLKTAEQELGKKKSSLTFEDNSEASNGNTIINSLLSFLPPILQVVGIEKHISKEQLENKQTKEIKRFVHSNDVKCNFFNPLFDKISEVTLPLEALVLIEELNTSILQLLADTILKSGFLIVKTTNKLILAKPKSISARSGFYFLRAYNYVSNKIEELKIDNNTEYINIRTPFKIEVPKFDLELNPDSATPLFIFTEYVNAIEEAKKANNYIRIKYKNRNDQLSYRTLTHYRMVIVKESLFNVGYLVGYCTLRHAERTFKLDRIQNLQGLELAFK